MAIKIIPMGDEDIPAIVFLWQRAGLVRPWNDPEKDIAFARSSEHADILVGREQNTIIASVMVGHDGHRGVVYYLAVDPDHQKKGLGRVMMQAAENWLKARSVWKLNLMIRAENDMVRSFYEALGYQPEERIVMARRLAEED